MMQMLELVLDDHFTTKFEPIKVQAFHLFDAFILVDGCVEGTASGNVHIIDFLENS